MVLGLAALGLAFLASPASAANTFTINETSGTGVAGSEKLIPVFISGSDSTGIGGTFTLGGIYIPYLGTMQPCSAPIGGFSSAGCGVWGAASIEAWASGLYYDPRFGTPFIPPSGDHHRTGYRMLMQPSFSGGQWLSGFAPLNDRFPFFPEVGTAGIGGDVGLAMANASQYMASLDLILAFVDHHGEPLTTGKFPRYWAHSRDAWIDNLMVKYTAGGGDTTPGGDFDAFSQALRSSVGFARNATLVRWRAMSNLDGAFSLGGPTGDCGGPWCEFYVTQDGSGNYHLFVTKAGDGNTDTIDDITDPDGPNNILGDSDDPTSFEITTSTRLDTQGGLSNGGFVLKEFGLSNVEKLPTVIDDRMAQFVTEMDSGLEAGTAPSMTGFGQQLLQQWKVYSGPNVHSEEGADPYSWVICGTRGPNYGEDDCAAGFGGAIDAGGLKIAIVYNSSSTTPLGESTMKRFGADINPGLIDSPPQDTGVYVVCTTTVGTTAVMGVQGPIVYNNSLCESDAGLDGFYGSFDDGTVYYKEAVENGLRGWIRENNAHAFSFLGADVGDHDGVSPANFGLTSLMQQVEPTQGALISCLNCAPHDLPVNVDTVTYTFNWPGLPAVNPLLHAPSDTLPTFPVGTSVIGVLP
jgi:hypothetical protein